jgi:hypothetical protein
VGPIRLKAGGRIGIGRLGVAHTKPIAGPGASGRDEAAKVTIRVAIERMIATVDHNADGAVIGSPDAEVNAGRSQFCADGALSSDHREE